MIIGLDVDDVIFDTSGAVSPVIEAAKDKRLAKYKLDIARGDASIPEVKEFWQKGAIQILKNAKPKPGAAEVIRRLRENGNKVVLIDRILEYYDSMRKIEIKTEDEREKLIAFYNQLANRDLKNLRANNIIEKDLQCEHYFEDAKENANKKDTNLLSANFAFSYNINGKPL